MPFSFDSFFLLLGQATPPGPHGLGSLKLMGDTALGLVLGLSAFVLFINGRGTAHQIFNRAIGVAGVIAAISVLFLLRIYRLWPLDDFSTGVLELIIASLGVIGAVWFARRPGHFLEPLKTEMIKSLRVELENSFHSRTAALTASKEALEKEVRQREEAEAEVRRLNSTLNARVEELQTLLDLLPVGIGISRDPECREIRSNKIFAEILGIPSQQNASLSASPLEMPPFKVLQNGRELAVNELPMQRASRENRPILDFEETIVRGDGREVQALVSAVPLHDADGRLRGCVATIQDITAKQLANQAQLDFERRLQETQKLESLGILAGGIAHDFNNLLTGILGNASIARLELPEGLTSVRGALDSLEHSALRAADLCKQMLAFAGKGRFVVEPLSLSRIVRETSDLLGASILRRSALRVDVAEGLPAIQGDATQIRQVLMNLVLNAAEALGEQSGLIHVRTSSMYATAEYLDEFAHGDRPQPGTYVCLEVTDTGPGMDRGTLSRIFDPFFTTKFAGRGLGLAAVLGIVRGHKGVIRATSQPGQGTSVKVFFPALDQSATPPELLLKPARAPSAPGAVLLVDDEEAVRSVAQRVMTRAGYTVVPAEDGARAVALVREQPGRFSVVLLDLTMPRMDGEEAFRQMRALRPDLPIVIMSGFNEQDTAQRFAGQGLTGFISKPFTSAMLVSKLQAIVGSV
jgi:signal transduction histidine kinase